MIEIVKKNKTIIFVPLQPSKPRAPVSGRKCSKLLRKRGISCEWYDDGWWWWYDDDFAERCVQFSWQKIITYHSKRHNRNPKIKKISPHIIEALPLCILVNLSAVWAQDIVLDLIEESYNQLFPTCSKFAVYLHIIIHNCEPKPWEETLRYLTSPQSDIGIWGCHTK